MKHFRPVLGLFLLLLATALACNLVSGDEEPTTVPETEPTAAPATETPAVPTDTPLPPPPTATSPPAPTQPPPTKEPPPTEEAPPAAALTLDAAAFTDPQGLFELYPPEGWIAEPDEGGASFSAPDDSGFINVEVTNTGLVLDGDSFERFVDARDANLFGDHDGYQVLNRQIDKDFGLAQITKRLLFDGIPQIVTSMYDQYGQIVYALDFWADEELAPAHRDAYDEIFAGYDVNSELAAELVDTYLWIYDFFGPGGLFTIQVPIPWRYELTEGDVVVVDTFYSPDEHGIIQNIAYDDGTEVSRSDAGQFALELLRTYYAEDIRITDDQVQPDGSERLIWNSPGGDYSGISFFETRGSTFLLFSVLWDNPFEDIYYDVLDYTISTYDVP